MEKSLEKFAGLGSQFSGIFQQFSSMMGGGGGENTDIMSKLQSTKKVIEEINTQFKNPAMTTFICVCIPEFLSLYETERLIQELTKFQIDTQNIIINQVLYPEKDAQCRLCDTRSKMQQKYVDQIYDLYELFHIIKLPLLPGEIRGLDALRKFAQYLLKPFEGVSSQQ